MATLIILLPQSAHADVLGIGNFLSNTVGKVASVVLGPVAGIVTYAMFVLNWIFSFIAGLLFAIAGQLVDAYIVLNQTIMSENPLLNSGFKISLGLANLGFVLAIIVIAFMTILRSESYGMKKMLWKLIVAAILVNFSLTIAGVMLDFTGVLSDFFMEKATGGNIFSFATSLAKAFTVSQLQRPNPPGIVGAFTNLAVAANAIASIFFYILFTVAGVVVMSGIAFMLLIRYIMLSFLLIVMPIAWLFWVTPGLEKHWSKWWDTFFKWTLFMPAATFFLYLAIVATKNISDTPSLDIGLISGSIGIFAQMILSLGLMVGGLVAAQKIGITGADAMMKLGRGAASGFIGLKKGGWSKLGQQIGEQTAKATAKSRLLRTILRTPAVRGEVAKTAYEAAEAGKTGDEIATGVASGKIPLQEVRARAGGEARTKGERRVKAANIMALTKLEKGGKFVIERPSAAGLVGPEGKPATIPEDTPATKKEMKMVRQARKMEKLAQKEKLVAKGKKLSKKEKDESAKEQLRKAAESMGLKVTEEGEEEVKKKEGEET